MPSCLGTWTLWHLLANLVFKEPLLSWKKLANELRAHGDSCLTLYVRFQHMDPYIPKSPSTDVVRCYYGLSQVPVLESHDTRNKAEVHRIKSKVQKMTWTLNF